MRGPHGSDAPVAIVGMGCRFPGGAASPEAYWRLLEDGVDAVGDIPSDRFDVDEIFDADPAVPGASYSRWGGFLERVDAFDADFFGISPREARRMDPQQRLLLEVACDALEAGGQPLDRLAGSRAGVFVGISTHDYLDVQDVTTFRERADSHLNSGTAASIAANRISYLLDLHGPSFAVDTACSSSLTAVHLARRSLAAGECDVALAAGVGVLLAPAALVSFSKASMLSPRGRCHAFDAGADGFVRGEGCGAVVLKTLDRAVADGDPVLAVLRGSAVNQDGRTTGLTVPSAAAQRAMIEQAHRDAGTDPARVGYVEAHGTGTPVGDPIEAEALGGALAPGRPEDRPCLIGSAKTNIGHLEAAAGIAGLIKTVLAVQHRRIPPSLHLREPNPAIPFGDLKLRVATRLEPWPGDAPALAGVNSFGFGGANAHVIVEEARGLGDPERAEAGSTRATHLLPLSARSPTALRELARRHRDALADSDAPPLGDYVHTAAVRRSHHDERLAVVAASREEARAEIDAFLREDEGATVARGRARRGRTPKVAFVFPGMGPQWWGMGRQLLRDEPPFRETVEQVDAHLRPEAGWSLLEELARDEADSRVGRADVAHVANLAIQLGVAAVFRAWGVSPDAVVGHSSGEMAAACVAGALSLPDAVRLAYHRGRLQHRTAGEGRMLAVAATPDEAAELLAGHEDEASLAAVNAPSSVTLSGSERVLEDVAETLAERGRFARFLAVDVPYHGPQMEAIRDAFEATVRDLRAEPADVPVVSEVTGDWIDGAALDGAYWWRNVREPVRFAEATAALLDADIDTFVQIGPHPVLAGPLGETLADAGADARVLASLRRHEDEERTMLATLAELYVAGAPVAWPEVAPAGRCVPLPSYPWQRERYWFDDEEQDAPQRPPEHGVATGHPLLGRRLSSPYPTWEARLDARDLGYLDDHGIDDATVFPGAGYLEMAFAAARELWGPGPLRLDDVRFHRLLFPGSPRRGAVQLHYDEGQGSVEIHARPDRQGADWTLHATARMAPTDGGVHHESVGPVGARDRCDRPREAEDLYADFGRLGYRYAGPFRSLREVRVGPGVAVGEVALPDDDADDRDPHRVHPGLLDGVLQLVALAGIDPDEEEAAPAGASFPVAVRRVSLFRETGRRGRAHVRVSRRTDGGLDELEADAWLVGEDGDPILSLEGLRLRALEERAPSREDVLDDALYELRWEEAPAAGAGVPAAARLRRAPDVAADVEERLGPPEQAEPDMRHFLEVVEPQLDRLADAFATAALERLGWTPDLGRSRSTGRLADDLGVVPRQRRLFRALAARARTLARMEPHAFSDLPRDAAELHRLADALVESAPGHEAEVRLVRRGGDRLEAVLRGEVDPREVMLTEEARELLRRFYTDSPPCRSAHRRLAEAIRTATAEIGEGRPLRVLELGAGTGAATEAVLPVLPDGSDVTFTDVSRFFWDEARARFGTRPDMGFATLDIEADPVEQGFEPHGYDLVFAANVLHVTRDLEATLGNVRRLLAEGGLLAVMELTRPARWLNLVFGLLEGWWRYEDDYRQRGGPLVDASTWHGLLRSGGFRDVTSLYGAAPYQRRVHAVQLAHAPAAAAGRSTAAGDAARHWWVFRDGEGRTDPVVRALRRAGDRCTEIVPGSELRTRPDGTVQLPPNDDEAYAGLLRTLDEDDPDGVVHAWSLRAASGEARDVGAGGARNAADVMEAQRLGSGSIRALARGLRSAGTRVPDVILVTAGAQAVPSHDAAPHVSQAAVWGFGRSLVSDPDTGRCRLVDLAPHATSADADALAAEIRAGDAEEEVALRGGTRYVRRLRRAVPAARSVPTRTRRASADDDAFRVELGTPGALESVRLYEMPEAAPGPGEVAIRVHASGLNFRDVLQALDMLPPSAYAAIREPSVLGGECAGVVVACGEGVDRPRPGDEVIALGTGTHASRLVTRADLTVPKPANLSFAEAASVLVAYVTADYALNQVARVQKGERVLVHAATGGVGFAALQLCRHAGAQVFATAGTPEKRDRLRAWGVRHVSDSRSTAFVDDVLHASGGEGVDVVLNSLSGEATEKGLSLLRPYGRFVELGKRDIAENTRVGLAPFSANRSYHAVDLEPMTVEHPERVRRLMSNVAERLERGDLEPIPTTVFDLGEAEDALRFMSQARHVGRVVLAPERPSYDVHVRRETPVARREGSYLVTGGLGGVGLTVAQGLANEGAGAVVLMSRSGRPPGGRAALDALRASGTEVRVVRGDVTQEDDVRRVLDEIRAELPPLRGVFHGAMVLDDVDLAQLDAERFEAVLRPKIAGAWILHRLTAEDDLDHFVAFSSVAAVLGHAMQGSYAAANAFLDALSEHRRGRGLPGLTVAWGALADVGYVARHDDVAEYLDRRGFGRLTPDQAWEALSRAMRTGGGHVVAAAMDWRTWAERHPGRAASPVLRDLVGQDGAVVAEEDAAGTEKPLPRLRAAAPGERLDLLRGRLREKTARILGTSVDRVDPGRPFPEMGFDSLMAVELVSAIRAEFEVGVPVVAVLQDADLTDLAERVLEELDLATDDGEPDDHASAGASGADAGEGPTDAEPRPDAKVAPDAEVPPDAELPPDASDPHPLSSEQLRFWYLERLHPGTPAYHVSVAARLRGRLDHEALERSLREVVARHEMLRAAVRDDHGTPVQTIVPPRTLTLPVVEIGDGTADAREAELKRRITEAVRRPFDLGAGSLLRATLFREGPEEHVLLLVVHHIVADAWAVTVLVREIAALYAGTVHGEEVRLGPPPARYLEHVERQRANADDAGAREDLAYWRRRLADAPSDLGWPAARRPQAAAPRRSGGHVRLELSEKATAALRAFSRQEGVTSFMTLMAAFTTLLHRHSGDEDLCVATAASTRSDAGADQVVGCYLDTLVLRSDLSGGPTFRELLAQVRTTTLEAFEHRRVPFDEVVRELRPQRGPDGAPLFRAMLVLHNARVPRLSLPGLELEQVDVESGAAVTDLALILDDGERLRGALEYDADRFDVATVQEMAAQLRRLLEAIPADADLTVAELPLDTRADARRRAAAWGGAATDPGPATCLHLLVEAQVDATPDTVAIESDEIRLSYAEMDRRAERLADRLVDLGVARSRPVGVCVPRSADRIVAALAVLKAGGAYLPLDPAHPTSRLHGLLADAAAAAVVTRPDATARFEDGGVPVVGFDVRDEAAESGARTRRPVDPEDVAYLIPTSGSTGTPKIVVVPHRAIVHQLRWRQSIVPLSGTDAVLFRTPVAFDPSIWETFGPLVAGARLVVPPPDAEADAAATMRVVAQRDVTVLQTTPAVLDALLGVSEPEAGRSLRAVFCGGEPLAPELAERCLTRLPAELHHLYGPAEATIDATHWRCRPGDPRPFVPIGRPIANTTVHVLDRHGRPAPVGVPGELTVEGPGVAHGYLNRPELTRERFGPGPVAHDAADDVAHDAPHDAPTDEKTRAYRTGDVGRWLPDGTLEFLGRDDRQVKVRGARVEPAEVEAVLRSVEAVRQAAVVPYRGPAGGTELAAFVTADEGVTSSDLEPRLAARLPAALLPTAVRVVDALPRTGADKVDRARLTAWAQDGSPRTERAVGPRTEVEARLLRLWQEHFPDQQVGVTDDFFELGGHSLSAMRLMARVSDVVGGDVPVSALIEGRTVAQLACLVDDPSRPRPPTVTLQPRGEGRPLFCVHPASGSAFAYQELVDALGDARPVHVLEAPDADQAPDRLGIEDLARRYAETLAELQPGGPYLLAGWSMGGVIAYETARRLEAAGASVAGLVLMDAWVPASVAEARGEEERALLRAFLKDLGLGADGSIPALGFVGGGGESSPLPAELDRALAWARNGELVPPDLDRGTFESRVRLFERHVRAMRAYRPAPFPGHVQLFEAAEPLADVRRDGPRWDDLAHGGVTRETVPGDHYSMMRRPHVEALAGRLRRYLERSEAVAS